MVEHTVGRWTLVNSDTLG